MLAYHGQLFDVLVLTVLVDTLAVAELSREVVGTEVDPTVLLVTVGVGSTVLLVTLVTGSSGSLDAASPSSITNATYFTSVTEKWWYWLWAYREFTEFVHMCKRKARYSRGVACRVDLWIVVSEILTFNRGLRALGSN